MVDSALLNTVSALIVCMAHRVFIRNLDQQQATKKTIALTFQEFGFYFVGLDQVQVVRSGGSSGSKASGRGQHCSAFVTLEDDHQVDAAVSAFDGKVIPLLSKQTLGSSASNTTNDYLGWTCPHGS